MLQRCSYKRLALQNSTNRFVWKFLILIPIQINVCVGFIEKSWLLPPFHCVYVGTYINKWIFVFSHRQLCNFTPAGIISKSSVFHCCLFKLVFRSRPCAIKSRKKRSRLLPIFIWLRLSEQFFTHGKKWIGDSIGTDYGAAAFVARVFFFLAINNRNCRLRKLVKMMYLRSICFSFNHRASKCHFFLKLQWTGKLMFSSLKKNLIMLD